RHVDERGRAGDECKPTKRHEPKWLKSAPALERAEKEQGSRFYSAGSFGMPGSHLSRILRGGSAGGGPLPGGARTLVPARGPDLAEASGPRRRSARRTERRRWWSEQAQWPD